MNKPPGQAGQPRGLLGRALGWVMAWHNAPDNAWTLNLLNVRDGEQILEVGFGPGAAIALLTHCCPSAQVTGIDHSAAMLDAAGTRNREAINAGKVSLQQGSVAKLPFPDAVFDKAFAINSIYFWQPPLQGLSELQRVLKPGGRLAVTVRDKQRAAYQAFRPAKLQLLLQQAGFVKIETHSNDMPKHPLFCLLGDKAG